MKKKGGIGIAIDNDCALALVDDGYRVLSAAPDAGAYTLFVRRGEVIERRIEAAEEYLPVSQSVPEVKSMTYDLAIIGGRVIDPESGLDAVRNVGVNGGRIETLTDTDIEGQSVIDAKGLVVAPGFIDLHSHGQDAGELRGSGAGRGYNRAGTGGGRGRY